MADTFTASGYLFLFHYINTLTIWLVNCCCIPQLFLWKSETAKQNQKWFTFEMLHCKHDLIEMQPTCVWQLRETTGGAKLTIDENRKGSNCKQHKAWLISCFFPTIVNVWWPHEGANVSNRNTPFIWNSAYCNTVFMRSRQLLFSKMSYSRKTDVRVGRALLTLVIPVAVIVSFC